MSSSKISSKTRLLFGLIGLLFLLVLIVPQFIVRYNHRYSYTDSGQLSQLLNVEPSTAIVFGGGIRNNQPRPVLEQRLLAAYELYKEGIIDRFILSGDYDSPNYDEPAAMRNYLIDLGMPENILILDSAGFSTYESCERAAKVFNIRQAVAVTQTGHLDRAIYLCRSFGIETYGFAAERAGEQIRVSQIIRELGSNIKAVFNVMVLGEQTRLDEANPIQ